MIFDDTASTEVINMLLVSIAGYVQQYPPIVWEPNTPNMEKIQPINIYLYQTVVDAHNLYVNGHRTLSPLQYNNNFKEYINEETPAFSPQQKRRKIKRKTSSRFDEGAQQAQKRKMVRKLHQNQ